AAGELPANLRLAIAIVISQQPEVRDAGVKHILAADQHARASAVDNAVEASGEHGRQVNLAIAIGVFENANAIVVLRVVSRFLLEVLADVSQAIFHGLGGEIVIEP